MKKSIISTLFILTFLIIAFAGGKDKETFKEKVEKNKEVKVFFNLRDEIIDIDDERKLQSINSSSHTHIKTPMPEEFASAEIKDKVIKLLNEGLQVSAFVEGDIETLSKTKNGKYFYRDLSKLPDGFIAIVDIAGEYTRSGIYIPGNVNNGYKPILEVTNYMQIKSNLFFYEVNAGKVKKYGDMFLKSGVLLGYARTATKKTSKLENLEYMEANFPALPLLEEYTRKMFADTENFAKRKLKRHNKVVAKRK